MKQFRARDEALATYTTYGRSAGSARVRVFDWLDHLGIRAHSSSYLDSATNSLETVLSRPVAVARAELGLRTDARRTGNRIVMISRQASPFSNGGIEARLLESADRGVYDFDDALMSAPQGPMSRVWSKRRTWERAVAAAHTIIAGNDYLAAQASLINGNIVVIPSCVEPSHYTVKTDYSISSVPTAVWLGSPSTEQYLRTIAGPLLELNKRRGLRLKLISAGAVSLGELDRMVDRRGWGSSSFAGELTSSDFGIMPLADTPWARGKCAYKLLQYGAAGLPMVGSPVGANSEVIQRADGLSPSTLSEWTDGMDSLITEPVGRRAQRGRAGRRAVEEGYSFAAWTSAWVGAMGLA